MDKKGIELSVNFIVMLILAIAVFGFGLYFVNQLFGQAKLIQTSLDKESQQRIEELLDRGTDRVVIPIASKVIKAGQLATFGLGVLNVGDLTTFSVDINCTVVTDAADRPITGTGCETPDSKEWTFKINSFNLKKNEKEKIPIAIQIPGSKPKGTYAFTITVTTGSPTGLLYSAPKQIYVTVS